MSHCVPVLGIVDQSSHYISVLHGILSDELKRVKTRKIRNSSVMGVECLDILRLEDGNKARLTRNGEPVNITSLFPQIVERLVQPLLCFLLRHERYVTKQRQRTRGKGDRFEGFGGRIL